MSRSQPALTNPSQHFFEWKGGEGKLEFYDKEKQQRITVPLPFEFMVLDQLATITGYSKVDKASFYSNEVRNTAKEEFTVKLKGNTRYVGMYKNDQGVQQVPRGAGYAKSIYIAHKTKSGEYIMGNIKAAGSALSAWIEFRNKHVVENGKIVMSQGDQQEAPTGPFFPPKFEYQHTNKDEDSIAIELDKQLQVYLSQYLATPKVEDSAWPSEQVDPNLGTATPEQVAEYKGLKREKFKHNEDDQAVDTYQKEAEKDVVIEDITDEPVNLDNIPF